MDISMLPATEIEWGRFECGKDQGEVKEFSALAAAI